MIIRPSGLNRTINCTASLHFCKDSELPDIDGDAAELGTVAHELAEKSLVGETFEHPLIDDDMRHHIRNYVEYCRALGGDTRVEFKVEVPSIHPECRGTLDFGTIVDRTLHIVDLKYGMRHVEIEGNYQLIGYGKGLLDYFGSEVDWIVLHVYQPRVYNSQGIARTWTITVNDLNTHISNIHDRVMLADSGNAYFETGNHCYKCPRLHDCDAGTQASYNAIDVVMFQKGCINSDSTQLGKDLLMIEHAERVLKDRKSALQDVLEFRIRSGIPCPTHHMETSKGNRKWNVSDDVVKAEAILAGIDATKTTLKSPAAMEKLGLDKTTVKSMITQPSYSKLKAIDFKNIKRIFKV